MFVPYSTQRNPIVLCTVLLVLFVRFLNLVRTIDGALDRVDHDAVLGLYPLSSSLFVSRRLDT